MEKAVSKSSKVYPLPPKNKMTWRKFKRFIPIYLLMLPGLAYLFINNYMPLPGQR